VSEIRKAEEADSGGIFALNPSWLEKDKRSFGRAAFSAGTCYVAERDGRIVAYVVCEFNTFFNSDFIPILHVDTAVRRQGIGERLIRHVESLAQTPRLFSSTNLSNVPMHAMFAKLKFEGVGMLHGLDEGDPEVVYRKTLRREV
jgi:N-acetylglutamate synthase-like GNAT family acetyltransferase